MVFSSTIFLFMFLPLFLFVYFLSPWKYKNLILLISSFIFYAWGENKVVIILLISSMVDFTCGLIIDSGKRKLGLSLSIIFNLSLLGFYKYFNFTFDNVHKLFDFLHLESSFFDTLPEIALPIGISFFTFQAMSYTIDVYRGDVKATRNFIDFATFIFMFHQLVAGPIVRYADIDNELKKRNTSLEQFSAGIERFIIGLAKKILLANTFATITDGIFAQPINELSTINAWIGAISYTFQIYYDFSGYSDMAIGLGKMLGFEFLENFNYPYISKSIQEFWRRWHISLSTWFRDYLYIPLGGNRVGNYRTYINLFIVFLITGLWHGASWNFVIWGLYHGFFIIAERAFLGKILEKLWMPIQHIYTLVVVIAGWVIFRIENLQDFILVLQRMFFYTEGNLPLNSYIHFLYIDNHAVFFFVIAIIFSLPVYKIIAEWLKNKRLDWIQNISLIVILILSIIYLSADSYNPFIYFRF